LPTFFSPLLRCSGGHWPQTQTAGIVSHNNTYLQLLKAADPRGKGAHRRRAASARNHTILRRPERIPPSGCRADPEQRHISFRPLSRRGTRRRQLCSDAGKGSGN